MKQIDKTHPIFQSKEYRKDRNLFHIIELNLQTDDVLLYSDEKNYVICRGAVGRPTWIWTVDGIEERAMGEVASLIAECYMTDNSKCKFTSKKAFYAYLKESNYPYLLNDYFEMGALECHGVSEPQKCDGFLRKAKRKDIDVLAKYWFDDNQEMNSSAVFTMQQAYEDIQAMLAEDTFFVWENEAGKIVCMVYYRAVGNQARLNHVYTPKEERGKGYATNLIHDITERLLELHLEPLLYTDYNYIASNRAYKNAGYQESGVLISFCCSKEE